MLMNDETLDGRRYGLFDFVWLLLLLVFCCYFNLSIWESILLKHVHTVRIDGIDSLLQSACRWIDSLSIKA